MTILLSAALGSWGAYHFPIEQHNGHFCLVSKKGTKGVVGRHGTEEKYCDFVIPLF